MHSSLCCFVILEVDSVNISPLADGTMLHLVKQRVPRETARGKGLSSDSDAFLSGFYRVAASRWLPC